MTSLGENLQFNSPQKHQNLWNDAQQVESVERIANDFGDGPSEQGQRETSGENGGGCCQKDTTDQHNTRQDLECGQHNVARNDAGSRMNDLKMTSGSIESSLRGPLGVLPPEQPHFGRL